MLATYDTASPCRGRSVRLSEDSRRRNQATVRFRIIRLKRSRHNDIARSPRMRLHARILTIEDETGRQCADIVARNGDSRPRSSSLRLRVIRVSQRHRQIATTF